MVPRVEECLPAGRTQHARQPSSEYESARLHILWLCLREAHTVSELAAIMGMSRTTVAGHVRHLLASGLLVAEAGSRGPHGQLVRPCRTVPSKVADLKLTARSLVRHG